MNCCSPTTITGTTFAQFTVNVAALAASGAGWTAMGFVTLVNGTYSQQFQQLVQYQNTLMYVRPSNLLQGCC